MKNFTIYMLNVATIKKPRNHQSTSFTIKGNLHSLIKCYCWRRI